MAYFARNNTSQLQIEELAFQDTTEEYTNAQLEAALEEKDELAVKELVGGVF